MLTEIEIVKEVLVYLDGWETDDNNTDTINESAYMSTEELSKNANKYITSTEIMTFYNDVYDEYTTTQRLPEITNVEKLLCKITAGRLWNKYNILVNHPGNKNINPSNASSHRRSYASSPSKNVTYFPRAASMPAFRAALTPAFVW